MDRLSALFEKKTPLLSIFMTAGYPSKGDTVPLCEALEKEGVDLIEIGFPFSDPLADGPVIQQSSEQALKNGMSLSVLFSQLREIRSRVTIPLVLMGYINPVLQYGLEKFLEDAATCGIDGAILPDLPLAEYEKKYRTLFERHKIHFISLISPTTSDERIRKIDAASTSFIYAVSSSAVTGGSIELSAAREEYFKRLSSLKLRSPLMMGFGISDRASFLQATRSVRGAIIGSAFIKSLKNDPLNEARAFVRSIQGK